MKLKLIQLWVGKIPDYFWFHYETTKNLNNVEFLIFTDSNLVVDSNNYRIIPITKFEIEEKVSLMLNYKYKISNSKKINDLKSCLGELFEEYLTDSDFFGFYDIDTLFGDFQKWVFPHMNEYDVISFADSVYHNRLCGPLTIFKNTYKNRTLYRKKINEFINILNNDNIEAFEEHQLSQIALEECKVKLIYDSTNCETHNGGKNTYEAYWCGNQVFVNGEEKLLYHFYRKNHTKFQKIGNTISAYYNKVLVEDFLWVVHFSENYETLLPYLIDSIKKYSNRKCVLYSINYTPSFVFKTQFESEQFIFRRIDIIPGIKDDRGRDSKIMNSKPLILMDAIKSFPNKKFVHIDTDIYLTTNADDITKYFNDLENYPLINSHIHDTVWLRNIVPNEEWSSPIHILLSNINKNIEPVYPRRKCNIIVFDYRSYWFFEEQMKLYEQFKDSGIPGILSIFDEDTANAVLSINELTKCLPLVDIEDSYTINIEKYTDLNHPFHMTGISPNVVLPKTKKDILFFHGFKNVSDYEMIQKEYGKSVLENEEFIVSYKDNTMLFEKNSFIFNKKFETYVDFIMYDDDLNQVLTLLNQEIYNHWVFFVSEIILKKGKYVVKIIESNSKQCIFNDVILIK